MYRCSAVLLAVLVSAWPLRADAFRLMDEAGGPPIGTTINGFNEVTGPNATEPGHADQFINPRPQPCPSCPAPTPAPPASPQPGSR